MTHFRKLVALVLREFTAQCLGKLVSEITAEDLCWYSQTLRRSNTYQGTRDTVKCILYILTGHNAKTQDVGDLVYKWIIRVTPLTSVSLCTFEMYTLFPFSIFS